MLRPSYNEQINGFGFNQKTNITADRPTTRAVFGSDLSCLSEVLTDQGSVILNSTNAFELNVLTQDQGGVGGLAPIDPDIRNCYSYSISAVVKSQTGCLCGFIGSLETAWLTDTIQTAELLALLPTNIHRAGGDIVHAYAQGFARPNVLPSTYANIANVVGLIFGMGLFNETGATIEMKYIVSVEVQRWSDPDVGVRTPVV